MEEGHLMPDHVHLLISIPPAEFLGHKFWARGCVVSTVGRDERAYIRNQEMADKQLDQMQFKPASS